VNNVSGNDNSAFGLNALATNISGSSNVAVGIQSLYSNSSGGFNTAIGLDSLYSNVSGTNNVALGYYAGGYELGSNAFYVDNQNRTNTAGDKAGALLYGTFNATPSNQTLFINASTTVSQNLLVMGNVTTANALTATNALATTTLAGGLNVAGTSGLTVLQNGNVGIGTTTPTYLLSVGSQTTTSGIQASIRDSNGVCTRSASGGSWSWPLIVI
jgi:hypothetical protein